MLALPAVLWTGLNTAACDRPATDSGVQGEVRIGPIQPVEQPGVENSRPYAATLLIRRSVDRKVVTQTTSAEDGSFKVLLPPGRYVLEPVNGDPVPYAESQTFEVIAGRFTTLRVDYDSGIR